MKIGIAISVVTNMIRGENPSTPGPPVTLFYYTDNAVTNAYYFDDALTLRYVAG